jgi:hypothetical protein
MQQAKLDKPYVQAGGMAKCPIQNQLTGSRHQLFCFGVIFFKSGVDDRITCT